MDTDDVAVVPVNGDSTNVKRIKKGTSGITLVPNNPAYRKSPTSSAERFLPFFLPGQSQLGVVGKHSGLFRTTFEYRAKQKPLKSQGFQRFIDKGGIY